MLELRVCGTELSTNVFSADLGRDSGKSRLGVGGLDGTKGKEAAIAAASFLSVCPEVGCSSTVRSSGVLPHLVTRKPWAETSPNSEPTGTSAPLICGGLQFVPEKQLRPFSLCIYFKDYKIITIIRLDSPKLF